MSNYTITLMTIINSIAGTDTPLDFSDLEAVIPSVAPKIFDFSYPFYNNSAKDKASFEVQFLWHFLQSEIGFETYGWWKSRLKSLLTDIMPKYKRIWDIEQEQYNMFDTVNMRRSKTASNEGDTSGSTENTTNVTGENNDAFSDTPQGGLTGVINNSYLTNFRQIKDTTSNKSNTSNTSKLKGHEESSESWQGKESAEPYIDIVVKERENALNINLMIFNDCEKLFMGVF